MEVPEQSSIVVENEASSSISIDNQENQTEYIRPSTRQRSEQQQQLLLVNIH